VITSAILIECFAESQELKPLSLHRGHTRHGDGSEVVYRYVHTGACAKGEKVALWERGEEVMWDREGQSPGGYMGAMT
jgi:hypothetical protein